MLYIKIIIFVIKMDLKHDDNCKKRKRKNKNNINNNNGTNDINGEQKRSFGKENGNDGGIGPHGIQQSKPVGLKKIVWCAYGIVKAKFCNDDNVSGEDYLLDDQRGIQHVNILSIIANAFSFADNAIENVNEENIKFIQCNCYYPKYNKNIFNFSITTIIIIK